MVFKTLRNDDAYLSFEDMSKKDEAALDKICFKRGINLDQTYKSKLEDVKMWLSISNLRDCPNSLLIFSRIKDFVQDEFEIDFDETNDQILRNVRYFEYFILVFSHKKKRNQLRK